MERIDFIKVLTNKNIMHEIKDDILVISKENGNVYLSSLTTMPDGIKFENQGNVYLSSLTTMPDGIKFENQGSVDLSSLTTMPDGIKFENQGNVYLSSLTTMPDGIKFENQGSVDLNSLTTMPDGIKFENQGNVYLRSLDNQTITYQNKKLLIRVIDSYTMLIQNSKQKDAFTIYNTLYFKGGDLKDLPKCYIAERDGYFAHGKTIKQAISDCNFKYLQNNSDISDIVATIKENQTVTREEYRLITGACGMGVSQFCKDNDISDEVENLPLDRVLKLTANSYGGEKMRDLFLRSED